MDTEIKNILEKCQKTDFAGIYKFKEFNLDKSKPTLIVITGPTGSGKSTFLRELMYYYPKVITATTRKEKRADEDENSFIWLEESFDKIESPEIFSKRIEEKYNLLESNIHAGNLYGIPLMSVETAFKKNNIAVVSIENHGAKALLARLSHQINLLIVFVLPDSFDQLKSRILTNRNDIEKRLQIARKEVEDSSVITNFYVHNTETNIYSDDQNPLEYMKVNIVRFIKSVT